MGNNSQSPEDQNADRNEDSKGQAQEVSNGNEDSVGNWTRGHACYILLNNLSSFCACPIAL